MSRTERTYYSVFGLYHASWSFLGPVYPVFLLDRGLDLFEINLVLAVYFLTSLAFEVPTGAVADRFGRKVSFLASCVIRLVAFTFYWRSSTFGAFLFAEFVDAIGTTLATGALDAWAIDGMRAEGSRRPASRVFANGHALARAAMIGSGLAGAFVADSDIALPWLLGAAGFATTALVGAVAMSEPALHQTHAPPSLRETLRDGVGLARRSAALRMLCLLTALTALAHMPAMILWPPRIEELAGEGIWLLGWVWVLLNLVAMMASAAVSRMPPGARPGRLLAAVTAGRALAVGLAALTVSPLLAVAGILVLEAGFGASDPVLQAHMSDGASARHRATVLSLRTMAFTCGGAVGLVVIGLVARGFGIPAAWFGAAIVMALAAPLFLRIDRLTGPPVLEEVVGATVAGDEIASG